MNISILGSGVVGRTISTKMTAIGHNVFLASRDIQETKSREKFAEWFANNNAVQLLEYKDIPADTDIFINCTQGEGSVAALQAIGKDKLENKIILDIANPLDFSKGMPPSLFISNTDSLGEQIQREFSKSKVVKGLNTMNCHIMMNPSIVPGDHNIFLSADDSKAKREVTALLVSVGWKETNIIDLGDISTARGTEMILPIWLRLWGALGTADFNFHIAKK